MSITELDINIDYNKLQDEYNLLNIDNLLKNNKHHQIAVQCRAECPVDNQLYQGTSSLIYNWDDFDTTGELTLLETPFKQAEFINICEYFKGTYFEYIIDHVSQTYKICRTRFMMSRPKTCLSVHLDATKRIHIPIYTNNDCFMVFTDSGTICNMYTNKIYLADTTLPHTAINASKTYRTHLVMCVQKTTE